MEGLAGVKAEDMGRAPLSLMRVQVDGLLDPGRVVHAFSTRLGGVSRPPYASLNLGASVGDDPLAVEENRRRFFGGFGIALSQVVRVRQVHGDGVLIVDRGLASRAGFPQLLIDEHYRYDALATNLTGLALVVSTADCVPILIHDPVCQAIAAIHAGWPSTAKRIAARAIEAMTAVYGTHPRDCRAVIGPSVRGCCYEVDGVVTDAMQAALPSWRSHAVPTRPGHVRLDLAEVNRAILAGAGVRSEHIKDAGLCTACRTDLFFSHRAEKPKTGRMMNLILLRS